MGDIGAHPSALQALAPCLPRNFHKDHCSEGASFSKRLCPNVPRSSWKFRGRQWGTGACSAEGCPLTADPVPRSFWKFRGRQWAQALAALKDAASLHTLSLDRGTGFSEGASFSAEMCPTVSHGISTKRHWNFHKDHRVAQALAALQAPVPQCPLTVYPVPRSLWKFRGRQ